MKSYYSTVDRYHDMLSISKMFRAYPAALYDRCCHECGKRSEHDKVGLKIVKFSQLICGTWTPQLYTSKYKNLNSDTIKNLRERLASYANKGNVDAIAYTIDRIIKGNHARPPKNTLYDYDDTCHGLVRGKKYDFFSMGSGFTLTDDDRQFITDFTKEYFKLK